MMLLLLVKSKGNVHHRLVRFSLAFFLPHFYRLTPTLKGHVQGNIFEPRLFFFQPRLFFSTPPFFILVFRPRLFNHAYLDHAFLSFDVSTTPFSLLMFQPRLSLVSTTPLCDHIK
jgi:hypothetical protein